MVYLILMLIISIGVAVFAVQNSMTVAVSFFIWQFSTSLVLVIISSLLAGILLTLFWVLKQKTQNYLKIKKLNAQINELEKTIGKLTEEKQMFMHTQAQNIKLAEKKPDAATQTEV